MYLGGYCDITSNAQGATGGISEAGGAGRKANAGGGYRKPCDYASPAVARVDAALGTARHRGHYSNSRAQRRAKDRFVFCKAQGTI